MIDIHAHTSSHQLWGLHTSDASLKNLERLMDDNGIDATIIMPTYFPLKKTGLPNHELANRLKGRKKFRMFGSLDITKPLEPQLQELAELAVSKTIIGIKLYPGYQPFRPGDDKIFPVYELARIYGLPVMFHGGELHHCCPKNQRNRGEFRCGHSHCLLDDFSDFSKPGHIATPARLFPDLKFIVSHLANPYFEELRVVMAEFPNVYTDISGQFISGTEDTLEYKREIQKEIRNFLELPNGTDRLMFATDFPIQSHADSIELIESLGLPDEIKEKIYQTNALSVIPYL